MSNAVSTRVAAAVVMVTLAWCATPAPAQQNNVNPYVYAINLQEAFKDIFVRAEPAVVTVFPESADLPLEQKIKWGVERMPQGNGSGFIIKDNGYLITNNHVVRAGQKYSVLLSDGSKYEARVIGKDEVLDIALMKIVPPEEEKGRKFPTVRLGDSDQVRPGMWAIALGNPIGMVFDDAEPVMSIGVVSGINRTFVQQAVDEEDGLRTYGGLIQMDTTINPGNSGGPLFNIKGEVIGINTLGAAIPGGGAGSIGINFAIPINTVVRKLRMLGQGDGVRQPMKYGSAEITVETLSAVYAKVLDLEGKRGLMIRWVDSKGAGAAAGLKEKDVILKINGRSLVNDAQYMTLVCHLPIDTPAEFEIWRIVDKVPTAMTINVILTGKTVKEMEAMARRARGSH
ncbi:MAG: trypsin-like peptidase domain-containing protein [Verrucomicrobia bacterium]|nr:trypsin-like peptidase domain-containing protein [Verrucomicrobiota bacterium]